MTSQALLQRHPRSDLVVVGAGIVGLAHAVAAVERGLSVVVVERDEQACGASLRNFGHGCITAQDGQALRYAQAARQVWVRLAAEAGFWLSQAGTVVVARHEDELAVLKEFAAEREDVAMLDAGGVRARVGVAADVVAGAWLPRDVRLDPREAVPAITRWLAAHGVRFHFSTSLLDLDDDGVLTSRGFFAATRVVVAVGHDVDRVLPAIAEEAAMTRCSLHMLRVANPTSTRIEPAVFTGWSLLRYAGFAAAPSLPAVRERLHAELPEAAAAGLHLMLTQAPSGDLTIGDTHAYGPCPSPFQSEELDELLLEEAAQLLGAPRLRVRERWQGVYASAPRPFLVAEPSPATRVVSVTSGIGMTTAFGLGADVIDSLVA